MSGNAEHLRAMADSRRALAEALDFFDTSVWLGEPEGFPLARELPAGELPDALARCSIRGGLVSHWYGKTSCARDGNEALDAAVRSLPETYRTVPTALPLFPAEEGLPPDPDAAPARTAGVRIFPKSHGFPLAEWMIGPLCDRLSARRLPLFIQHTEIDWSALRLLASAFPGLPVVVESQPQKILYHTRPLFALMRESPNVLVETSNFVGQGFIEYAVREFGAHRLLFGSFFPVNDPLAAVGMVLDADIPETEKRLIAGGNIRRIIAGIAP